MFDTVLEFMKLEKIEIGGIKGKMLSAQGVLIHEEFQEYFAHFATQVRMIWTLDQDERKKDGELEKDKKEESQTKRQTGRLT